MTARRFSRTPLALVLIGSAAGCAATTHTQKTSVTPLVAAVRVDPPRAGQANVYLEFRDLTASGLEDEVYSALEDAVVARGWSLASDYYSADYVLWADLRLFGESGTEEGDQALNNLGGVAAGAAVGYGVGSATDNWWLGVGAGTAAGYGTKYALDLATRVHGYQMVVDLVLGRKVEGGVETRQSSDKSSRTASTSGVGTAHGAEGAVVVSRANIEQDLEERRVHFDLEQRLLATCEGRRMTKDMAKAELIPKLVEGVKSQLPPVRS